MRDTQFATTRKWVAAGALGLCVLAGSAAGAQGTSSTIKDDLFAGTEKFAQNATGVNEISMDPDSLGLVNGDRAHRAHNLVLNVVRTYEYDKPGMYRVEDVEAFRKKLETGEWHCSVHTRDLKRGDSTDVCNRRRTDGMVESAIITVEPKQLTFIHTIRKMGDGQSRDLPAVSGFGFGPGSAGIAQLAMIEPMLDAQMAGLEARMEALGPEMQARMAMAGPKIAAELGRLQALHPDLHEQLHLNIAPGMQVWRVPAPRLYVNPPTAPKAPRVPE